MCSKKAITSAFSFWTRHCFTSRSVLLLSVCAFCWVGTKLAENGEFGSNRKINDSRTHSSTARLHLYEKPAAKGLMNRRLWLSWFSSTPATGCPATTYGTPPTLPGKKGACFTLREPGEPGSWVENMPKVIALNPYWNHSWGPKRLAAQPNYIEFMPMIWGLGVDKQDKLDQLINDYILPEIQAGTIKRILGFNEPDSINQANMLVDTALEYWPTIQSLPLAVVSPSVANMEGPWIDEFITKAESKCARLNYLGIHWFAGPNPTNFKQKLTNAYLNNGKRQILLTEFAVADWSATTLEDNRYSKDSVLTFMKDIIPWMEQQDWIAGYTWFSFDISFPKGTSSALFHADGTLTALGQYYASVTTENPNGDLGITY